MVQVMEKIEQLIIKHFVAIIISTFIIFFSFIIYFIYTQQEKPIETQSIENPVFDLSMSILKKQNDSLNKRIKNLDEEIEKLKSDFDSLEKLKPKLKIKYDEKIKELNSASNLRIYTELKSILAKDSIR